MVVLALTASAVHAEPKTAKEFYVSATSHYNLSEWKAALDDFREAYRLKPDNAFLFNIAQCQRQLGAYHDAANSYRAYRREGGTNDVEKLIAEMDAAADRQRQHEEAAERERAASVPPTGVVTPTTTTTTPTTTTTAPSTNTLVTTPPERQPITKKAWFWGVLGAGVAVVAVGVTLGVVYGTPPKNPSLTYGTVAGN
jgi:predicted S18 family serine protease